MKSNDIFSAIGEIDEKLVNEAASMQPERKRIHWLGTACTIAVSAAACCAVILFSTGIWTLPETPGSQIAPVVSGGPQASETAPAEQVEDDARAELRRLLAEQEALEKQLFEETIDYNTFQALQAEQEKLIAERKALQERLEQEELEALRELQDELKAEQEKMQTWLTHLTADQLEFQLLPLLTLDAPVDTGEQPEIYLIEPGQFDSLMQKAEKNLIAYVGDGGQLEIGTMQEELPVFANPVVYSKAGVPAGSGLSVEEMKGWLYWAAGVLKLEIEEPRVHWIAPLYVYAEGGGFTFRVEPNGNARIEIESNTALRQFGASGLPDEEIAANDDFQFRWRSMADDLARLLKVPGVEGGESRAYNVWSDQLGEDFSEDINAAAESLVAFYFRRVDFAAAGEGKDGYVMDITNITAPQLMGNYPIISAKDALQTLLNGQYQTIGSYDFPGEESLVRMEIVYRTGVHGTEAYDRCLLPYYRFWALQPELGTYTDFAGNEISRYAPYYVPAVRPEYITNMP